MLAGVAAHRQSLTNPASAQRMVAASTHFYEGREAEVATLVRAWLDQIP
jgi:hypothetical protein